MNTITMKLDDLLSSTNAILAAGDSPRYANAMCYLMNLLPTIGLDLEENEDGEDVVLLTQDDLNRIHATINAYNRIQRTMFLNDDITLEQCAEICQDYDPLNLEQMWDILERLDAKIQDNNAPHGPVLSDGFHKLPDGRTVLVEDGRAIHLDRKKGIYTITKWPYRWNKRAERLTIFFPWATEVDIASVTWLS